MNITFEPPFGWMIASILLVLLCIFAVWQVVQFVVAANNRKRGTFTSDITLTATIRRILLCITLVAIALFPSVPLPHASRSVQKTDIVIAVDTTGSMAVSDAGYGQQDNITRLQASQLAVADILKNYPNMSYAALSSGSYASLDVPLTPDSMAITNWAQTLRVEPTGVSTGSDMNTLLDKLLLTLRDIRKTHSDDALIVIVLSDGEQTSEKNRRTFSSLRQYVDDAVVYGVGSSQGGRIPVIKSGLTDETQNEQWIIDPDTGQPGISKMDAKALTAIADEMGGAVIELHKGSTADYVSEHLSKAWQSRQDTTQQRTTTQVWPLSIVVFVLLLWEAAAWFSLSRRFV